MAGSISDDSTYTESLLDRANKGDHEAFNELVERNSTAIRNSIRRRLKPQLRQRVDHSDILQETRKKVFQSLADFMERRPMPFRLWLFKTAQEEIIAAERAHLLAQKRSVHRELPLSDESSCQLADQLALQGPVNEAVRREYAKIVRRCLTNLSEADRQVLMLRCFDGLSSPEIADMLEENPDAIRKRFARALIRLKKQLEAAGLSG